MQKIFKSGAPGRIRTYDVRLRRPTPYPLGHGRIVEIWSQNRITLPISQARKTVYTIPRDSKNALASPTTYKDPEIQITSSFGTVFNAC